MDVEIAQDDDPAFCERRQQVLLEPGFEGRSVHGAIIGLGRDDAPQTQAADEGDGLVMAMRNAAA
jgi:hypothetical protein